MKTVTQKILDYIDSMPFAGSEEHSNLVNIIQQEFFQLEKSQIIDAYDTALYNPLDEGKGEEYFKNTYQC